VVGRVNDEEAGSLKTVRKREMTLVAPLIRTRLDGRLYQRPEKVEALLGVLEALPRSDVLARCTVRDRSHPDYVPSECLLHFVRASRSDNSNDHFERLYRLLTARVLSALPRAMTTGETEQISRTKSRIQEKVFDRFVELLAEDRQGQSPKLDYFEVRFDGALASLRRDAQELAWREENRTSPLEHDPETNELSDEVERAVGSFDPFDASELGEKDYRLRLDAAIDALPPLQSRIITMLRQGYQIDSKDPDVMTIAKALKKSEKTIRTHRNLALATLQTAMSAGEER
jgi:hypothetical protein